MIELAESSSVSITPHEVAPRSGTGTIVSSAWWGQTSGNVIFSSGWGEAFELGSPWELGPLKTLMELRSLPRNWDGAGSPPPTNAALNESVRLLRVIGDIGHDAVPVPHVVPLTHGGVQFEWMSGNRELEIAVFANGAIEFVTAEDGDPQLEGSLSSFDQMRSLFMWLTAAA